MPEVYRADHVGSLLRPPGVHRARAAYREGTLEQHQLRVIEDAAILHALERQQAAGVDIYTDGEFRRTGFQNDLIEAVEGYVETDDPVVVRVWRGPGGEPTEQGTRQAVGSRLRQRRRLTQYQAESCNRTPRARSR
jgi:5-methyltetrahydropteroyltriglutamate--homocysteine methyltransferase